MIDFTCGNCGHMLSLSTGWSGLLYTCPECGKELTVPWPKMESALEESVHDQASLVQPTRP
jgi:predicted  nucleic acid-binding Zn-ribbon protein